MFRWLEPQRYVLRFQAASTAGTLVAREQTSTVHPPMPPSNPDPRYEIAFDGRDRYLHACVSGPFDSIEISLAYWREVVAECRRLGYSRLLVRENLGMASPSMSDPAVEYYLVGCELPKIAKGIRVAFVDTLTEEFRGNRLGEGVAIARGLDARLFLTEEEAIAWLSDRALPDRNR